MFFFFFQLQYLPLSVLLITVYLSIGELAEGGHKADDCPPRLQTVSTGEAGGSTIRLWLQLDPYP